jgi:hypothetical protein
MFWRKNFHAVLNAQRNFLPGITNVGGTDRGNRGDWRGRDIALGRQMSEKKKTPRRAMLSAGC